MLKGIFKIGKRRILGLMLGNILLGIGAGVLKFSGMGNDPYSAMILSVSSFIGISYFSFLVILNTGLFVAEIIFGRKNIGLGTFVNWFLAGYVADFSIWFTTSCLTPPEALLPRIFIVLLGVAMISLGVSLYQTADAGIAPYDSIPLILDERIHTLPYFWCRMICDGISAAICLLTGGLLGLGTFLCAFCLGPFIHFFNIKISQKLLYKNNI